MWLLWTALLVGAISATPPTAEYFQDPRTWDYLRTALVFDVRSKLPGVFEGNPYPRVRQWFVVVTFPRS